MFAILPRTIFCNTQNINVPYVSANKIKNTIVTLIKRKKEKYSTFESSGACVLYVDNIVDGKD